MKSNVESKHVLLVNLLRMNTYYKIPDFQRKYVWNAENIVNILDDFCFLLENKEKTLYIGNILLKIASNGDVYIVDGQQRITTIILLLRVLKDMYVSRFGIYSNSFIKNIDDFIYNETCLDENSNKKEKKLIISNLLDQKSFNSVIDDNEYHKFECLTECYQNGSIYHKNYYLIYKIFYNEFNNLDDQKYKKKLAEILNLFKRIWIINIKLSDKDNEFKIFETLNSRGTPLEVTDLIKNLYFIVIEQIYQKKEKNYSIMSKDKIEENILSFFDEKLNNIIKPWLFLSHKNKSKEIEFEFTKLIKEFIIYKALKLGENIKLPNEKSPAKLYDDFKKLIIDRDELKTYEEVNETLKDLERFLMLKNWIKQYKILDKGKYQNYELSLILLNDLFSGSQFISIIIQLLDKYASISEKTFKISAIKNEFIAGILYLEKLIIRRNFTSQGSRLITRTINKIKINNLDDLKKEFETKYKLMPNRNEFSDGLNNRNVYKLVSRPVLKAFLWKIELNNNEINSNETINSFSLKNKHKISIEHILPQNIDNVLEWQNVLKISKNDDWEQEHQKVVNNLGNLTLSMDNSKMQNYSFQKKRKFYLSSPINLNRLIGEKTSWNKNEILERTKEIANKALIIWK